MAKKVFQSLKFTEGLMNDLKILADMKQVPYNTYVEGILSNHVLVQKKALRELTKHHTIREDVVEQEYSA